jgi:hypothetical protein
VGSSNSSGYWQIDLIKTKCLKPGGTKYTIQGTYPGSRQAFKQTVTVPDSSSWYLTW